MDIKVDKEHLEGNNYFEDFAIEKLQDYFKRYSFLESIQIFCRGSKHKYKKVKLQVRLKGKDVFVEARGGDHEQALTGAIEKLYTIVEKYKSKHYKRA